MHLCQEPMYQLWTLTTHLRHVDKLTSAPTENVRRNNKLKTTKKLLDVTIYFQEFWMMEVHTMSNSRSPVLSIQQLLTIPHQIRAAQMKPHGHPYDYIWAGTVLLSNHKQGMKWNKFLALNKRWKVDKRKWSSSQTRIKEHWLFCLRGLHRDQVIEACSICLM